MSTHATITTYTELERWGDAFLKPGGLNLLFLVGNPGNGKSASFKAKLVAKRHEYINAARLTSFQPCKQLFRVRNKAIILDDVDDPLKRSDMARLLMTLCETDEAERTVAWLGTESLLRVKKGQQILPIPPEFKTKSRVCIISNEWKILTGKFGALLDRGTVLFFSPAVAEMHLQAMKWCTDKEICEFIGKHLGEIPQHSFRYYVQAAAHKLHGLDWKATLLESWTNDEPSGSGKEKLVINLLADPTYKSEAQRIAAFASHPDGGKRRTWFNLKKKLGLTKNGSLK